MSKAEERALERCPKSENLTEELRNERKRAIFTEGYNQAEKDLELSWKDFVLVRLAFDATEANIHIGAIKIQPMTKEYYQEVLKCFKDLKKGNNNDLRRTK